MEKTISITFFNWMVPTLVLEDKLLQTVDDFKNIPRLKKLFIIN